jgi:excisionase family DNA binding protein
MNPDPNAAAPDLLTVTQAAELLRVHRKTILRWVARGRLAAVRIGREPRIPRAHLTPRPAAAAAA